MKFFLTPINHKYKSHIAEILVNGLRKYKNKLSIISSSSFKNQFMKMERMAETLASFMFVWAIISQYCPNQLIETFKRKMKEYLSSNIRISIHEFTGHDRLRRSEAYSAVEAYLSSNTSMSTTADRLKAEMETESSRLVLSMEEHQKANDEFRGAKVCWVLTKAASSSSSSSSSSRLISYKFILMFHRRYREIIVNSYLDFVVKKGNEIRFGNRPRKLYTNCRGYKLPGNQPTMWSHIVFEHPASFETVAMETEKKKEIIEDLLAFRKGKEFYARIGKAWKRGYLLYGPPGTGKSTMVAAMANLLSYDVYDLELTAVKDNTELRKLLIETTGKSIIVIEDIDCSLDLTGQRKKIKTAKDENQSYLDDENNNYKYLEQSNNNSSKVTLSGLLNFIDGLWSSCGGERIIVFTTNYVEKLDPALIRRGRMDKHIELSYCSFEGFKVLAKNYLKLEKHQMFDKIEKLMVGSKITPADVAENLMPKSLQDDPEKCLSNLIKAMEEGNHS